MADGLFLLLVDDLRQILLLLILIFVAPSPCGVALRLVASIAGALNALLNDLARDGLQVVRPSDLSKEVDESCCHVHSVVAQLGGLVVPWEDVLEGISIS